MRSRRGEPLGFHGVVLPSDDPARDARRWAAALGLGILRRSSREVVLGRGPEFFVSLVRAPAGTPVELHLAVEGLRARNTRADDLGGDGVTYDVGPARVTVREFRRPPSGRWADRRRKAPRRPRSK
ncbi:MAG TPA: hypothetical protein VGQ33_13335 [Vicinamibacteria bacterium]|nr:hypothetical protein [Vicinamibacteria bacterium]